MALLKTFEKVKGFVRNPFELARLVWLELAALDTRVADAEAGVVAAGSISTAELADGAVTAGKMSVFYSTEQTGNGSAQNVAHGLGETPTIAAVIPSTNKDGADCVFSSTKGSTNVVVTATTGAKYFVLAIK